MPSAVAAIEQLKSMAINEPVFVLRARDPIAADIVRAWAWRAQCLHVNADKVEEARRVATKMDKWTTKQLPD